ncbi:PhzF family phenazine biosynthesis protein [Rhodopirellula sp. JC740]|uniref:PhzF family phenazine biosynthesis protein n=1 Tax=Rhodopirellula halodulae TaxID=2894198 RepID=A0ABS8NGW8_9BACT|nr:PhzF family phenazine biosynthesis protein [Rhodopirellula sp. JC740]MCC9642800.1 PhzF family phenazine biosynthesis protein [Rhodopirellula sp. JC740]
MKPNLWQVDAFASRPFEGNPAAICVLEDFPCDDWMQSLAGEINLSETAYVVPGETASRFQLRWFTPNTEVDLCGHATLAAAHVLNEQGHWNLTEPLVFETRSGDLTCLGGEHGITLNFPASSLRKLDEDKQELREQLAAAFPGHADKVRGAAIHETEFDLMLVFDQASSVHEPEPNLDLLQTIPTRGVMVTAPGESSKSDFVSRFFAPQCGIAEDPVTGSAHCALAPYWSQRLQKDELIGYQASQRGGYVRCEVQSDRVLLTGSAVTILESRVRIPIQTELS